jgi:hypothetical protein
VSRLGRAGRRAAAGRLRGRATGSRRTGTRWSPSVSGLG